MYSVPQRRGTSNFCQQVWQREVNIAPQHHPLSFRKHLYRERFRLAKNLYKYDLRAHFGCVNAIEFSRCGELLASGGDDKRVLLWNVEKSIANVERPHVMATEHTSNIFSLGFDSKNERLLSGGNDDLVVVHDIKTSKSVATYKHESPVYGLSIDPTCDRVFATACEDGQILLYDQRLDPADPFVIAELQTSFHAVEFHPISGRYLITANSKCGAAFWDIRKPNAPVIKYGYPHDPFSCMSVRFNSTGTLLLALRRRRPPVLYRADNSEPVATFFHKQYYNSCTMKSCTFAGEDDELILSGSDDFNLYAWHMNGVNLEKRGQFVENAQMVLYGHRSIVNQVRYNRHKCMIASSGVEKIVKLWSPFEQKGWCGSLIKDNTGPENPRELYLPRLSNNSAPPHSWSHMSHDYSSRNTNEDPRMMAFFDSLIQQEIEGWEMTHFSSDSENDSNHATTNDSSGHTSRNASSSSSSTSSSSSSSSDDNDDDNNNNNHNNNNINITTSSHIAISLSNTLDDVPSAVEAQETEPCTESARRYKKNLRRNLRLVRRKNRKTRSRSPEFSNRIAFLIATKSHYLRRLAKRGMKRKPCTCLPNRVAKLKPLSQVLRPLMRPSFTQIIRIPANTNGRRMSNRSHSIGVTINSHSSTTSNLHSSTSSSLNNNTINNSTTHEDGRQLPSRKSFRKYVPSPSPTSSSSESFTTSDSSTTSSSALSYTTTMPIRSSFEDDDLNNPVPSTSSRAMRTTRSSGTAMPSTSTGRTSSSIADIARLRQNQQMILVTDDDDDESEDDNVAAASQTMSRNLRSRAQLISEILPPKKINGVRRLNDELIGIRRSSRLMNAAASVRVAAASGGGSGASTGNENNNSHQETRSASDSTDEANINDTISASSGVASSGDGSGSGNGGNGRDQREQEPSSSNITDEVQQAEDDDDGEEEDSEVNANENSTTIIAPAARTSDAALIAARGGGRNRLRRSYVRETRHREIHNDFYTTSRQQSRWLHVSQSSRTNNLHSTHETEEALTTTQSCPLHGSSSPPRSRQVKSQNKSTSEVCRCSQSHAFADNRSRNLEDVTINVQQDEEQSSTSTSSSNSNNRHNRPSSSREARDNISKSQSNNNDNSTSSRISRKRGQRTVDESTQKKKTRKEKNTPPPPPISPSDSDTSAQVKDVTDKCSGEHKCTKHRKRDARKEKIDKDCKGNKHEKKDRKQHRCEQNPSERNKLKETSKKRQQNNNNNSLSTLSDDQPSTSAAALAARNTSAVTSVDSGVCDSTAMPSSSGDRCRECGSVKKNKSTKTTPTAIRRSAVSSSSQINITTSTTSTTTTTTTTTTNEDNNDDYRKKMERVKRVYAKYFESDSD